VFQNQHGSLVSALTAAGLSGAAATQIARILSNPKQSLRTGPIEQDTTPEHMRLVQREEKLSLPNLDFREADADYRTPRLRPSEEQRTPEQKPTVTSTEAPQAAFAAFGVTAGNYLSSSPSGDSSTVSLNLDGENGGLPVVDTATKSLFSKRIDAQSNANGMRFLIERNNRELVWKLMFEKENAAGVDVVTDVSLGEGGIVVKKRRIYPAGFDDEIVANVIGVQECP
jgi:hypothetical protein